MVAAAIALAAAGQKPEDAPSPAGPAPIKSVLVVQNRIPGVVLPMESLADKLTAKLSGTKFCIVNPANVIGIAQNRTPAGEPTPEASATELAQALGADALLTASIVDLQDETTSITHQYTIKVAFSLADARSGAAVCGAEMERQSPKYTYEQIRRNSPKYLSELLYAAAADCAELLEKKTPPGAFPERFERQGDPKKPPVVGGDSKPPVVRPWKPRSDLPAMRKLDDAIEALLARMQESDLFIKNYSAAKSDANRLPIIVIGGLEDKTAMDGDSIKVRLEGALATLRVSLFNTRLFEVKDDEASVALARRIINSGESPLEKGELMELLKTHSPPDFFVTGDLRSFADDGYVLWRLRLAIHNFATGKTVWEGIQQIVKQAR